MNTQNFLDIILPDGFDPGIYFLTLLAAIAAILAIGGIFRLCFGKGSIINGAFSSAIAIASIYAVSILVYRYESNLSFLFDTLPFVSVSKDHLTVFPIMDASFQEICSEIMKMMVLSFLMNLLETWLPKGKKLLSWFGFRFLALSIAICLNYCINLLMNAILQENILAIAPLILLGIVLLTFLLACLKLIIGGVLSFINPLLGLFYGFFFRQDIGQQLLRAMITTLFFTVAVYTLNALSYTAIPIAAVAVATYLPIILLGWALWFIISKFL